MKIKITGASAFVTRLFEACGSYQWAREFLQNAIEAKATRVEFGLEWQAVRERKVYRRTVVDNGEGMSRDELRRFFATLGEGGKSIGGVHDNFGVGAKVASLPWNPEGVVVISYKGGEGSMIWMVRDDKSGDYELVEFGDGAHKSVCIEPGIVDGINWGALRPEWLTTHGTIVVLLGSKGFPDTFVGNIEAGEVEIKGLSVYLNTRFWDLSGIDVRVAEPRTTSKARWPREPSDEDETRRVNWRRVMGAKHYIADVEAPRGKPLVHGAVALMGGLVSAEWYLWDGERPHIDSYARRGGYIALRYKGELFEITASKTDFRSFGVIEHRVQTNLTIVLEPKHYTPETHWGVHPDQSRNRLIFSSTAEKGTNVPLADWGLRFIESMPAEILAAIKEARGIGEGSVEDEDVRRRLRDKFGQRWALQRFVKAAMSEKGAAPATTTAEDNTIAVLPGGGVEVKTKKATKATSEERVSKEVTRLPALREGNQHGVDRQLPVDIPRYRFAHAEEFERPWHIAMWAPNDPTGPHVLINTDSFLLESIVRYHQDQYHDIYAEEVAGVVRNTFGEIAVCKVAHTQKLTELIPEEELDRDYRSEAALTAGLLGLLAEETVLAHRLLRFGKRNM
jgi:hypothetical protein